MDILVNADQWASISPEEKGKILDGLKSVGSLKEGDRIVPDSSTPMFDPDTLISLQWDPIGDLCRIACDTAAGTAFAWCSANTAGAGTAICMAAAEAVRQKCRDSC